jgi:hydroxymethylbilane synthase
LARWQADWVAARLAERGVAVDLVLMTTRGDREQIAPIGRIAGGDGVFVKELERALLADEIDLAVHSLKDLPTAMPELLVLAAVPERGPTGDLLLTTDGRSLEQLPAEAIIGTGSLRRRAQLLHVRTDLRMADIRGNLDTRLAKLDAGHYDAIILAEAGIERLKLADRPRQLLPKSLLLPAVGQGALGLQTRAADARTRELLAPLQDAATRASVDAERTLLATLSGGCLAPVGAWGRVEENILHLSAVVLSADGVTRLLESGSGEVQAAAELGQRVATALLARGAAELIAQCRASG